MKRYLTVLAAAALLALPACSTLGEPVDTTDYAKAAYAARTAYAGALVVATQYAKLPRCSLHPTPPCSDRKTLDVMLDLQAKAGAATLAAEDAARVLRPGDPALKVAAVAAQQSVAAFKSLAETSVEKQKGN